jgi:hypothetical protein
LSWKATAYVKELSTCPDGVRLNRGQKLLALILADYHNATHRAAWPSVPTLAREALTSHAQAKRDLAYLEEHKLIRKVRPEKMGRGWICAYEFLALDAAEGVHDEPLFSPNKSSSDVAHLHMENSPEVAQKGFIASSVIRKNKELEPRTINSSSINQDVVCTRHPDSGRTVRGTCWSCYAEKAG